MSRDIYNEAMESFEDRYSDFIVLFDSKAFYAKVRDEVALTGITKPATFNSIILDAERAVVRLLDRGALGPIQKFGTTREAEEQIPEQRARASPLPRGTAATSGST